MYNETDMEFVFLSCLLAYGTITEAGPGRWDDKNLPVDRANGIYCTLDATTIKGITCRDAMIFDVWVKYYLDEKAWRRIQMI